MKSLTVLGRAIVRLRKERGWTQEDLADRAELSAPFVAALEQAKRTPSVSTLDALCTAFGVTPSALFVAGEDRTRASTDEHEAIAAALTALPHESTQDLLVLVEAVARIVRSASTRTPARASTKRSTRRKTKTRK